MLWVLIIIVWGTGNAVTVQSFTSEGACLAAEQWVKGQAAFGLVATAACFDGAAK